MSEYAGARTDDRSLEGPAPEGSLDFGEIADVAERVVDRAQNGEDREEPFQLDLPVLMDDQKVLADYEQRYGSKYIETAQHVLDTLFEAHMGGYSENREMELRGQRVPRAMFVATELYPLRNRGELTQEGFEALQHYLFPNGLEVVEDQDSIPKAPSFRPIPQPVPPTAERPVIRRHVAADPWKAAAGDFEDDD